MNFSKFLGNFKYKKFNPSINEWNNSIYSFKKSNLNVFSNTKLLNSLLNNYFNLNNFDIHFLKRIFVGISDIKFNLNKVIINIYIFNKEKSYYLKRIYNLNRLMKKTNYYKKFFGKYLKFNFNKSKNEIVDNTSNNIILYNHSIKKILNNFDKNKNVFTFFLNNKINTVSKIILFTNNKLTIYSIIHKLLYINDCKYLYKGLKHNLHKNLYTAFLYKKYISKLYINNIKFNLITIKSLINIINNIYNKKVILRINNMKYLYMDNSLFIDTISRKLKNRKRKVLSVLRRAIFLSKIPIINSLLLIKRKKHFIFNNKFKYNNIISNTTKYLNINIFNNMKNTHIIGILLEGKGRLTRRLIASRSIHKSTHKGTFKNIYSSMQGYSSILSNGYQNSNVNYINVNNYNRIGSYGIKSFSSTY